MRKRFAGYAVQFGDRPQGIVPMQSGYIQCSALWGRSANGASLAPPAKLYATNIKYVARLFH